MVAPSRAIAANRESRAGWMTSNKRLARRLRGPEDEDGRTNFTTLAVSVGDTKGEGR